jgi:hypothetical protein
MRVTSVPFSNGTEGYAWMSRWCDTCTHDHEMHDGDGPGCELIALAMIDEVDQSSEAWIAEPDDGTFALPSRMLCTLYQPCTKDGCDGDPWPKDRAEIVGEVMAYWRDKAVNK